jgi:hemerythrin
MKPRWFHRKGKNKMYPYTAQGKEEAQKEIAKVIEAINYYAAIHFAKEENNESTEKAGA